MTHGGKRKGAGRRYSGRPIRRPIGFSEENYAWLQAEKERRKVSMAAIINELIEQRRGRPREGSEG
jgi:hypothetical protein